jgi:hypothetical protein
MTIAVAIQTVAQQGASSQLTPKRSLLASLMAAGDLDVQHSDAGLHLRGGDLGLLVRRHHEQVRDGRLKRPA